MPTGTVLTYSNVNNLGAPRPKTTNTSAFDPGTPSEAMIPFANVGQVVPWIQGRQRVRNANCVWFGEVEPITETSTDVTEVEEEINGVKVITKTTVTTTVVVGYYATLQLALCLGPGVVLKAIYADEEAIWEGTAGPARTEITLPQSDTTLNNVKAYFSGGAFDQGVDPIVTDADAMGYVGVAYIILRRIRIDSHIPTMEFEVERYPNPLGLSAEVLKGGADNLDINLASATVEVLTNGWGAGGLDINEVDLSSFQSAATLFDTEGNFCSMTVSSEMPVSSPLKILQQQGDMMIYPDPQTGKIKCLPIRPQKVDLFSIPRFYHKNIQELRDFNKTGWQQTIEQLRGTFVSRNLNYKETPAFWQNPANMASTGRGKRTASITYPYCMTSELCLDLMARDGSFYSYPSFAFTIVTNRDGADLVPGQIISVTWSDYNLLNLVCQVMKVRKHPLNDNKVTVYCQQVIFPDSVAIFGAPSEGSSPDFDLNPKTPTQIKFVTAPYWVARTNGTIDSTFTQPVVHPMIFPKMVNDFQQSFTSYIENVPGATENVLIADAALYPTYGQLVASLNQYDGFDTGEVSFVDIDGVTNLSYLQNLGEAGIRAGQILVYIGDEILGFESFTDMGGGTYRLNNVHRGLLDTVPATHAADTHVVIYGNNYRNTPASSFDFPLGYTPDWKIVPNSAQRNGYLSEAMDTTAWSPSAVRILRPPRPHDTRVNTLRSGIATDVEIGSSVTVTWKTRSRLSTQVALQLDAAETAEVNDTTQEHRVYHRSAGGVVTDIGGMAYSGNSATFTMPTVTLGAGTIYVEASMTVGGVVYTSLYQDRVPVNILPDPTP